jgi:hypothetical protein
VREVGNLTSRERHFGGVFAPADAVNCPRFSMNWPPFSMNRPSFSMNLK